MPARRKLQPAMPGTQDAVEAFLAALRETHPDMVPIFTQGGCFRLFCIMRTIWPQAIPWSDIGHVYIEIDGRFYDIRGRHQRLPEGVYPMDPELMARAHRWHRKTFFRDRHFTQLRKPTEAAQ